VVGLLPEKGGKDLSRRILGGGGGGEGCRGVLGWGKRNMLDGSIRGIKWG